MKTKYIFLSTKNFGVHYMRFASWASCSLCSCMYACVLQSMSTSTSSLVSSRPMSEGSCGLRRKNAIPHIEHQARARSTTLLVALLAWSTRSLPMADIPNMSCPTPRRESGRNRSMLSTFSVGGSPVPRLRIRPISSASPPLKHRYGHLRPKLRLSLLFLFHTCQPL